MICSISIVYKISTIRPSPRFYGTNGGAPGLYEQEGQKKREKKKKRNSKQNVYAEAGCIVSHL